MKAPVTVKERHCVCNGGTEPEICDFCCSASFSSLNWFAHLAHLLVSVSLQFCSLRRSHAVCQTPRSRSFRQRQTWVVICTLLVSLQHSLVDWGMFHSEKLSFQLLGLDVISNCALMFVLISCRGLMPGRRDKNFKPCQQMKRPRQNRPLYAFLSSLVPWLQCKCPIIQAITWWFQFLHLSNEMNKVASQPWECRNLKKKSLHCDSIEICNICDSLIHSYALFDVSCWQGHILVMWLQYHGFPTLKSKT